MTVVIKEKLKILASISSIINSSISITKSFSYSTQSTPIVCLKILTIGSNRCKIVMEQVKNSLVLVHAYYPCPRMLRKCKPVCMASLHLVRLSRQVPTNRPQLKYQIKPRRNVDSPIYFQQCPKILRFVLNLQLSRVLKWLHHGIPLDHIFPFHLSIRKINNLLVYWTFIRGFIYLPLFLVLMRWPCSTGLSAFWLIQ